MKKETGNFLAGGGSWRVEYTCDVFETLKEAVETLGEEEIVNILNYQRKLSARAREYDKWAKRGRTRKQSVV